MRFEVTILGSSSATPIYNRNPSAQALNINEHLYLVDCGEGTQQQMLRFDVKASRIDHIFISHLHGDHYLGLVGLLSSMHLNGRIKPLKLFGPPELKEIIDLQLKYSETELQYHLDFTVTHTGKAEVILDNQDITVETIPLEHRIACTGFLFRQKKRLRKLMKEKIERLNIPVEFYSRDKKRGKIIYPRMANFIKTRILPSAPKSLKPMLIALIPSTTKIILPRSATPTCYITNPPF